MTAERKHRCGGTLRPREVQVQDERDGMLLVYRVPGLVCDACQEELIERDTMLAFEKSQTPTVVWEAGPATSYVSEPIFNQTPAGTVFTFAV